MAEWKPSGQRWRRAFGAVLVAVLVLMGLARTLDLGAGGTPLNRSAAGHPHAAKLDSRSDANPSVEIDSDWTIGPGLVEQRSNETIVLKGNLTVRAGGSLFMDNVTLFINSTTDGQYGIIVDAGGELLVKHSMITAYDKTTPTVHMGPVPPLQYTVYGLRYHFDVSGNASITGSTIEYLWGDDLYTRSWVPSGLVIYSDNVSVDSSRVMEAEASALWITGCSPSISRSLIAHTGGGAVRMDLSNASFAGNTVEFTGESGVSAGGLRIGRGNPRIVGNTIQGSIYIGGVLGPSTPLVADNSIVGHMELTESDARILNNTIASPWLGIAFGEPGSDPLIENNTISYTGSDMGPPGIINDIGPSHGRIVRNTIQGFDVGIFAEAGSDTLFSDNTVTNANISVRCRPTSISRFIGNTFENSYVGFEAAGCQAPAIENNTFRNNKALDFFVITGGVPSHLVAVNNSFDPDKVLIAEAGSDLTIENYLDGRVLDRNLRPLPGALVQVDTIGRSTQLAYTNSEGAARWFRVPYVKYEYDGYNFPLHTGSPFKLSWFSSTAQATYPGKNFNNLPDYPSPRSVNMSRSHWEYFIEVGAPDMVELSMESVQASPNPALLGTSVSISAVVRNWGHVNATNVNIEFRNGGMSGTPIGGTLFGEIGRLGGKRTATMSWIPPGTGDYTLCAIADPLNAIPEPDESDNGACTNLTVVALPDLAVTPSDVSFLPAPPFANGSTILITAAIRSAGFASSPATSVRFHDGVPPSPAIDGDVPVGPIPVGGSDIAQVQWTATRIGGHEICVVADPDDTVAEINKANNMACVPVQVLSLPDLAPTSIATVPPSPIPEGTLSQVNVTIVNAGDLFAGGFDMLLFDDSNGNLAPNPGEDIGVLALAGIVGHSQSYAEFAWTASPADAHSLCAYADPPPGVVAESNETNNVMCMDILVQPGPVLRPDYIPVSPLPLPPIRVGMSSPVSLSIEVLNQGNGTAIDNAIIAFHEQSSPPFSTYVLSPLAPAATSSRFTAAWTSPATPGIYLVSADVDYYDNVSEWDETNNVYTWTIEVVAGPVTALIIGNPNYTSTVTYVKSITPLGFSVIDQSGLGIRNTAFRIDGGAPVNYTAAGTFFLAGEGEHTLEWRSLDWAGNLEDINSMSQRVDDTPPATTLSIGDPKYLVGGNVVTSSTPLTLLAVDGGITPVGLDQTDYRVDGANWKTYSSPFPLAGEGAHVLEYRSRDLLGNSEAVQSMQMVVDDTPPSTAIAIGEPKYLTGGNFVTSSTPLTLSAADGGVGSNSTFYRLWGGLWSSWRDYSTSFSLAGRDGTWYVEFLSFDYLGNSEAVQNETLILDDTPPVTTISPSAPFNLTAADSGCGVNVTMYRIDGGSWAYYTVEFTITEGEHTIYYYSTDRLGNVEQERSLVVKPPVEVAVNYKPIVALIFAIILFLAGVWSSKRRPWKGGKDRMAVAKAFAIISMPFILVEAVTGIISLITGMMSIPPPLGIGTLVDTTILVAGVAFSVFRGTRNAPREAGIQKEEEL